MVGAQLEERPVIDDILEHHPHVVGGVDSTGDDGRGPGRVAVGWVVGVETRRVVEVIGGQVLEQMRDCEEPFVLVGDDERRDAGASGVEFRPAERPVVEGDAGERPDRVGTAHVRERVVGHDGEVGEAQEQRRSGHARPDDQQNGRDNP